MCTYHSLLPHLTLQHDEVKDDKAEGTVCIPSMLDIRRGGEGRGGGEGRRGEGRGGAGGRRWGKRGERGDERRRGGKKEEGRN